MEKKNAEGIVKGLSQVRWEAVLKESGMDKLGLDQDTLNLMQSMFETGMVEGANSTLEIYKDIYWNDMDLFEDLFDEDEDVTQQ